MTLEAVRTPQPTVDNPPSGDPQSGVFNPQSAVVDIRSVALTVLAVIAIVLMLQYAQAMVIPIVLGVLISYALEPVVAWMRRRHVPRPLAAAIVLVALTTSGGWLLYSLPTEASAIVERLPQAAMRLRHMVEHDRPTAPGAIAQVQKAATELEKAANGPSASCWESR